MIRLTLNAQSEPEIHLFHQSSISLGSDASKADLIIPDPEILPIHLKIFEQNGFVIATNEANDPFVSINGQPFGKKLLNSGDIIMAGHTTILFENLPSGSAAPHQKNKSEEIRKSTTTSKIIKKEGMIFGAEHTPYEGQISDSFKLPFEPDVEALSAEEFEQESLDSYLEDLGKLESLESSSSSYERSESLSIEKKPPHSLKDDYLKHLDDDNDSALSDSHDPIEHGHLYQAWRWIIFFVFSTLIISIITGSIFYLSVSDKSEAQESKAAQGVADIAMALTYAKLNHLKPHNQNWSDVEFLKSNLKNILPDSPSFASKIDSQGQFNSCPYTLRIYTNTDLSHFLLIAQPAPNIMYWLIPQPMVIVDSHLMELRTHKDVRSLNRLLANPNPLEGANGSEITNLVKQGGLISLSLLASETSNAEFEPPKNLAWFLPGAENLIYNAPRYHRLGQKIIQQAINLTTKKSTSQEVTTLKQEVQNAAALHHLILYSDQGKKAAQLAQKGISMFAPSEELLFGYLLYNSQGKMHQVHLLQQEEHSKETSIASADHEELAFETNGEIASNESSSVQNNDHARIDRNHPIFIQLQSLAAEREAELKPLISALCTLINQELSSPRAQFQIEYQNLSHAYLMANAKHKRIIKENLESLYQQYENLPIHEFFAFIQALNLDHLMQKERQSLTIVDENCQINMESLLTNIEDSQSLAELNNVIHTAASWLNFDYIKDPRELMRYQNLIRNRLLEQLERYLLTQNSSIAVRAEDHEILQDILNQERLIKSEERDFFLEEFEAQFHDQHNP